MNDKWFIFADAVIETKGYEKFFAENFRENQFWWLMVNTKSISVDWTNFANKSWILYRLRKC